MSALLPFWLDNSLFGAAVLCTVGYLTASPDLYPLDAVVKIKISLDSVRCPLGHKNVLPKNHHHRVSYTK